MSELDLFDVSEQICYVQCGFCTTILLVSVPCNSMKTMVRVRCGHCSAVFSLNMTKASFLPFHLFHHPQQELEEDLEEIETPVVTNDTVVDELSREVSFENEEGNIISMNNQIVNKPPEKRQRAPSAYNRFIREEIKRLKAENPNMTHKAAFSTASKNWAHFPPIEQKEDDESQREENVTWESNVNYKGNEDGKVFRERKLGHEEDKLFLW